MRELLSITLSADDDFFSTVEGPSITTSPGNHPDDTCIRGQDLDGGFIRELFRFHDRDMVAWAKTRPSLLGRIFLWQSCISFRSNEPQLVWRP